jgi:hypothetical protein
MSLSLVTFNFGSSLSAEHWPRRRDGPDADSMLPLASVHWRALPYHTLPGHPCIFRKHELQGAVIDSPDKDIAARFVSDGVFSPLPKGRDSGFAGPVSGKFLVHRIRCELRLCL